jgi:hypothetical protein
MTDQHDLPEGVIDADPPGGWESGDTADGETAERHFDSIHAPSPSSSGLPPLTPPGADATADAPAPSPADGGVEDAAVGSGIDPDLRADEDTP